LIAKARLFRDKLFLFRQLMPGPKDSAMALIACGQGSGPLRGRSARGQISQNLRIAQVPAELKGLGWLQAGAGERSMQMFLMSCKIYKKHEKMAPGCPACLSPTALCTLLLDQPIW
jgi:hypothetical protein